MPVNAKRVDLEGGGFLHVNESGIGNTHHVLWLHGAGPGVTARVVFDNLITSTADSFHNVAPDMLGYADSEHPSPAPRGAEMMEARVDSCLSLMEALGISSYDIVGLHRGSDIATRMAAKRPERVRRLLLVGGVHGTADATPGIDLMDSFPEEPTVLNLVKILESFCYDPGSVDSALRAMAEVRVPVALRPDVQRSFVATNDYSDAALPPLDYGTIGQSTLVVHGADDQVVFLERAMELFRALPNADIHVLGQCGHVVQIEKRDELENLIRMFLVDGD